MSVHLIANETTGVEAGETVPPSPLCPTNLVLAPCANTTCVLIGRNGRGQWIARERHGLYGGLFTSRAAAVHYALFENGHRPEAIVMVAGALDLDMASSPDATLAIDGRRAA